MSTMRPVGTRRQAVSVQPAPAATSLTIRWSISRRALRSVRPGTAFAQRLAGIAESGPDLELAWNLDLESGHGTAGLIESAGAAPIVLAQATVRHSADGDLRHLEVREGGDVVLVATIRAQGGSLGVLYARTPLLSAMGLGGGRYEVTGLSR